MINPGHLWLGFLFTIHSFIHSLKPLYLDGLDIEIFLEIH